MLVEEYKVNIQFTTPCLGTTPMSREIFTKYVQSKARELSPEDAAVEVESITDIEQRGTTGFFKRDGKPFMMNYQIKGFLSEASLALSALWPKKKKSEQAEGDLATGIQTQIKKYVHVFPREIFLEYPGEITMNERALRCLTMQGPRVSLAKSEQIDDARLNFTLKVCQLSKLKIEHLQELFSYGQFIGLSQWRSGGWGQFETTIEQTGEYNTMDVFKVKKPKDARVLRYNDE